MRSADWKSEIRQGLRKEKWSLSGPNRIVKVMPLDRERHQAAGGFITLARFLLGLTPKQIENELGLPKGHLESGARIYRFARLPGPSEYDFELTAKYPNGLAYNPAHGDPRYGPGSDKKLQWQIHEGVQIPVDGPTAIELLPGQRFTDML